MDLARTLRKIRTRLRKLAMINLRSFAELIAIGCLVGHLRALRGRRRDSSTSLSMTVNCSTGDQGTKTEIIGTVSGHSEVYS